MGETESPGDGSGPAPEPQPPFPWDRHMPGKSVILVAGGVLFGGLGTLVLIGAADKGLKPVHLLGVIAIAMMVVGFERIVAVTEMVWRDRFLREDAAATAERIRLMELRPPLVDHRKHGDSSLP